MMLIRLIFIQAVVGWRGYQQWTNQFGQVYEFCPELHIYMPSMHPHYCVSFASICQGVTDVVVKTVTNGTSYICHPRFQPWGAGTLTQDDTLVHCGYEQGIVLVMEMLSDGRYKFYCKQFTDVQHEKCLVTALQQNMYRCQYCKPPFFGDGSDCDSIRGGIDLRFTYPVRYCKGQCIECDENKVCSKCNDGSVKRDESDDACDRNCQGFTSCDIDKNGMYIFSGPCIKQYYLDKKGQCQGMKYNNCETGQEFIIRGYSCDTCMKGYVREILPPNEYNHYICSQNDWNCGPSRQQPRPNSILTDCTQCDPGYFQKQNFDKCLNAQSFQQNCNLLDSSGILCVSCMLQYALQPDGTCLPFECDFQCITCLDINPSFCTTCDISKNRILDNYGNCKCIPKSGWKEGYCPFCTDGYCQECEQSDFYSCISCKSGSNRILQNKQCICKPGTYDPGNEDQICLACDYSCLSCFGPSNQECIECLDESISNRIQIGDSCPCQNGYADYKIKESYCGKCHPRCNTCFQAADQTTNQYCLTCKPGQNRVVQDNFNCDCKENYSDLDGTTEICARCYYTCGNCSEYGPTYCTFCLESSNRYLTSSGECICKTSYFDDETDNIECSKCHYSCILCANSIQKDACELCPQTRKPANIQGSEFECICSSSNFFDDGFSQECLQCDYTCQTCNGPLSSNCLTCDPTYRQLDLSSCVCPTRYYDIGQLQCEKCHYSCHQCFDNTVEGCIACSLELNIRVLKGNICNCADGFYEESGIALCKKCSYKCQTCETQSEQCLSCPLNSLRVLDPIKGCYCLGEYYEKENEIACQKCHFKCKSCNGQNENNCLSCDSVANRELEVNECKCQIHYFEMEVQECTVCSAFCYECINNFENCTSCNNDRFLVGSTCKCITKFNGAAISTFDYNGMVKCQNCHYSCGTCGGIEEIQITDIKQEILVFVMKDIMMQDCLFVKNAVINVKDAKNNLKDVFLVRIIPLDNLFQVLIDANVSKDIMMMDKIEVCQKCHYSCLRCNDIETKCELCSIESNRIYNDQLFTCDCNIGYYDIGIENCQKCHYSCLSCNSGDVNSCISCVPMNNSNRVLYNNTCKCLFGYFDDGQSISCKKCDIQCLSCVQQSYQCLSCPQTRKIETNCKCQQGYYDVGLQLCLKCNSICLTCEISSNNCTSCHTDQYRELNQITQTCDCQIGYLEINGICEQCQQSCKTCSQTINKCTSCVQFRILKNNDCICNDGMYESSLDKQCKLCNKTCLTCVNSNTYCLTCSIENFRQFKTGNTCDCMPGYYENPINQNCEKCSSSCSTCSLQYDNCLTCDTSLNLSMFNNKCLCSQSYFFDSLTNSCQQCNITCLECQNSNVCTSCRLTTRHLDSDQKKCICHDGYFETNQQNCQQCHLSCETCENIHTYCLTCMNIYHRILINNTCQCIDGYYEAGIELCQKCNSICKTCQSSASSCLSCQDIQHNRYYQGNKCLCKPGYFESNTEICSKCSNECLTCQGQADYCTSCDINSKRIDQSIIHKCPCITGFYQDENKNCQKCHIKCQTCINQNDQCLSCNFKLNSNRMSLSDKCNCKEGYFDDGIQLICQQCNLKCKTCVNETNNCQICQNSIRINPPICNCMDGYYEDEQLTCQICSSQCNTCILEPSNCLTCKPGRIDNDCKCIDGYFEIGLTLCSQCAFQCATCDFDPLNCKTCKGNRFQEPQCICQSGYFDDQINEECQKCDSTCLECNLDGCLSCFANRLLNQEMDCIPPPNSVWYNNTPWCSTCQVAVIKAYLSDDISKIIIHFDFPLNPKGFNSQIQINKCLQLFEVETVLKFGQNSVCYINQDNNQELLISLGEYSKIEVGEEILFKSNSISHINCETTLEKFIFTILQMPINPLPPQIEYNVPLHKLNPFADNSVFLKSIKNNGNRKLDNIIWSCQVKTNEDSSALSQFIDQINFVQEYNLLIPKLTLPSDAELKFKIQYENFIHINSYSEFIIYTHLGDLPQININVKPSYFVYETIIIGVTAGNLGLSTSKDNIKYQIQLFEIERSPIKSISSQLNISVESFSFEYFNTNISQYTLSPNSTYTFQVIATNLYTQKVQNQNLTFDVPFAGLICQFNNQGIQSIRQDLNLQIYCRDLDTKYEWNDDLDLYIEVDCKDLTSNRTCQNEQKQAIKVNNTNPFQFIRKNSISSFTVQEWSVNVTKFHQTSKFTQIIVYLDNDFPVLDLEFNQGYLMRKINNYEQLNFTFLIPLYQKAQLLDLSIAIIYNYQVIQILQPKYISHQFKIFNTIKELNFGDDVNLKFAAQYTNNIMPSLNNIKLSINQPPQCSKLFITRSSDLALNDIQVTTTCQQSNDFPYRYQLRLFLRESDLIWFLQGQSEPSSYSTKFGNYQICANDTQILKVYEMQCVMRTISGKFHKCNLNRILNNETMEQSCECNKFGDIFLTTSTNISKVIVNNTQQQELELDNAFLLKQVLVLVICTGSLTLLQFTIYIFYLIKEYQNQKDVIIEKSNLNPPFHQDQKTIIYQGNSIVFKEKFKEIHQTASLFYYSDQDIQLSYRILEVFSQFNLLLSLTILECSNQTNQIHFIFLFIIINPFIILILRIFYKIIEAIYRFRRIAAFISNFILIILLMAPNLILLIFYILRIQIQQEQYMVAIIFLGNTIISQILVEPITIFARIIVYRLIASSIKNTDLNPIYHFMHFFVMHSSLEEIFEEFTRM
ncbi:unnamed protein product [Paramecium pentaurelia]|uniref:EGF-like domain-containing protein n=1 Tax=Paramecium pentaurelia TaxID=43138 RepID=A0A8S1V706_9CILI|nr:unnamed protein product [Paramecium pentaurelia]